MQRVTVNVVSTLPTMKPTSFSDAKISNPFASSSICARSAAGKTPVPVAGSKLQEIVTVALGNANDS